MGVPALRRRTWPSGGIGSASDGICQPSVRVVAVTPTGAAAASSIVGGGGRRGAFRLARAGRDRRAHLGDRRGPHRCAARCRVHDGRVVRPWGLLDSSSLAPDLRIRRRDRVAFPLLRSRSSTLLCHVGELRGRARCVCRGVQILRRPAIRNATQLPRSRRDGKRCCVRAALRSASPGSGPMTMTRSR